MKRIFIILLTLCVLYSCNAIKMPFESNYSQWRFNNDSNIVHNVEKNLVFDYFDETDPLCQLYNEGMDDEKDDEYYKKYIVNEDDLHFFTKQNFKRDNPRRKFFNICTDKIPFLDSVCYIITDNIMMFTVKENEKWQPDYFCNALEVCDWKNTHIPGTKTVFNDSIVWRNIITDSQNMIFMVVDRFKLKDKIYGIAYIDLTVSKKFKFNAYPCDVSKIENICLTSGFCFYYDQFSKRFVKQNTFGYPTVTDYNAKLSEPSFAKIRIEKTPVPKDGGIFYDSEKGAVFDTENHYVFDLAKDTIKGFDDFQKGEINLTTGKNLKFSDIKIPVLTASLFSVNDKFFVFEFDKAAYLRPNYEIKADETFADLIDDEYTVKGHEDIWSPNHKKKQPYNFIWRNLYFDKGDLYVVDRMLFQDKGIAAVYKLKSGKDYPWDFSEIKNCINTAKVLDNLTALSRRFVLSNNYWTVGE